MQRNVDLTRQPVKRGLEIDILDWANKERIKELYKTVRLNK
jgi:hypothetical protein